MALGPQPFNKLWITGALSLVSQWLFFSCVRRSLTILVKHLYTVCALSVYPPFVFAAPPKAGRKFPISLARPMSLSSTQNRNLEGKNQLQYGVVCESSNFASHHWFVLILITVPANNPVLWEALEKYHRELISDNVQISELLLAEYGIDMK